MGTYFTFTAKSLNFIEEKLVFNPFTDDPFELFNQWYDDASKSEINDPNAMSLATVGENSMPSVRIVLLKSHNRNGFVFYTNLKSRKGTELSENPHAAIAFHWKTIRRQVRIEGSTEPVTKNEADEYFQSRARISQIGAWASQQSQPLDSREQLLNSVKSLEKKYENVSIPRPPHWGGLRLRPKRIEFWHDGEFRLHDRFIFEKATNTEGWEITRLNP